MSRRTVWLELRSSWKELTLAIALVLVASWVGLTWTSGSPSAERPTTEPTSSTTPPTTVLTTVALPDPIVTAQLLGPTDPAPLGESVPFELQISVRDAPARRLSARLPLAPGLTTDRIHTDDDGDCAPDADGIVCSWPELEGDTSVLFDLVLGPAEPTCRLLVLCLEATLRWDTPTSSEEATAAVEIGLRGRTSLLLSSFESAVGRTYTVSNTSTEVVGSVSVRDPGCAPIVAGDATTADPGATLVFTCADPSTGARRIEASGVGASGLPASGSLEIPAAG